MCALFFLLRACFCFRSWFVCRVCGCSVFIAFVVNVPFCLLCSCCLTLCVCLFFVVDSFLVCLCVRFVYV